MTGPDSTAVGQPLRRFATSCDSAFKTLLAKYGFAPVQAMRSPGKYRAVRLYRSGDRYVRVTASTDPRDAPAHCTAAVGEGSHQFPEGDWNSIQLLQLAVHGATTSPLAADRYVLRTIAQLPAVLRQMSLDLESAAADFLSGDVRRFRAVRAAVAASRAPYTIWAPAEKDRYVPREDPVSAALRARYAAEGNSRSPKSERD